MESLQRAAMAALFVLFLAAIAFRPLQRVIETTTAFEGGLFAWPTVLWLLLLSMSLLVVVARVRRQVADGDDDWQDPTAPEAGHHRNEADMSWDVAESTGSEATDSSPVAEGPGDLTTSEGPTHERPVRQRPQYRMLGGKGGARERGFDIEQRPPEAALSDHLDHLRAELDEETAGLDRLEEVVAETEQERAIPERCPDPHCSARWTERSVLGINTGRYEVLDDGERVVCLACESVVELERE